MHDPRIRRGYTIIETLFYVAILVILTFALIQSLIPLGNSYRRALAYTAVDTTAQTGLERMTREIRDASSVDLAGSTLSTSPGTLKLNTTDVLGTASTVEFFLTGTTLHMKVDGIDIGPLSPETARITHLQFRKITTTRSSAIKIEMTVESGEGSSYQSRSFNTTIVLRGSYPST